MVVNLSLSSHMHNKQLLFQANISKARQQVACLFASIHICPYMGAKNGVFSNSHVENDSSNNRFAIYTDSPYFCIGFLLEADRLIKNKKQTTAQVPFPEISTVGLQKRRKPKIRAAEGERQGYIY